MPVNLLTKRLKDAKRELTNLKTAYTRGLGFLRVYDQILTITDGQSGMHELDVIITLDNNFAEYPYAQLFPAINESNGYTMEVDGFSYTNSYQVRYHLLWWERASSTGTNSLRVLSSSPIKEITYNWTS